MQTALLSQPILSLQIPYAPKMVLVVGIDSQFVRDRSGSNQYVSIGDQFASLVKISVYLSGLHYYGIGDRQYATCGTQLVKYGKLLGGAPGVQTAQNLIPCDN